MITSSKFDSESKKSDKLTAKEAVTKVMHRRSICRAGQIAEELRLKESTVANIMYSLYVQGYAVRRDRGEYELVRLPGNIEEPQGKVDASEIHRQDGPTMPAKVIELLKNAPDQSMSFEELKEKTGFSRQATGAVMSNLLKREIVSRPRRGFYELKCVPGPYGDRAESVLRYLEERPWSRITEIQRGADRYVSADTVRKVLRKFVDKAKVKKDGYFYALQDETRDAESVRSNRKPAQPRRDRKRLGRVGRPPKTRRALLSALKSYTRPRSADTLAKRVGLSVGAVRSVLSQLVAEGKVRAVKLRTDREDLRLVFHYQYVRDED